MAFQARSPCWARAGGHWRPPTVRLRAPCLSGGPAGPPRRRACLLVDERPVGLGGRSVGEEFINSTLLKTCVKESHSDAQESRKKRLAGFRSFAAPSAVLSDAFTSASPQPLPALPHSRRSSFAAMPPVAKCFQPSTMALTRGPALARTVASMKKGVNAP